GGLGEGGCRRGEGGVVGAAQGPPLEEPGIQQDRPGGGLQVEVAADAARDLATDPDCGPQRVELLVGCDADCGQSVGAGVVDGYLGGAGLAGRPVQALGAAGDHGELFGPRGGGA